MEAVARRLPSALKPTLGSWEGSLEQLAHFLLEAAQHARFGLTDRCRAHAQLLGQVGS
jgi:hypothetical protein